MSDLEMNKKTVAFVLRVECGQGAGVEAGQLIQKNIAVIQTIKEDSWDQDPNLS